MKRSILACMVLLLCCPCLHAQALTQKQKDAADQLISLVSRGSSLSVLKSAVTLSQRLKPQQLDLINEYLSEQNTPPVKELAANARYGLVLQGLAKSLPKPSEEETLFSIPIFEKQTKDAIARIEAHELMQKTLPILDSLESYQDLFWDVHVLENQLQNAYKTATYGSQLTKYAKRFNKDDAQEPADTARFSELALTLERLSRELIERKVELRLDRLQLAGEILHDSDEFRPRLFAARAVDTDGELLMKFFDGKKSDTFTRERLNEPDLKLVIADEVNQFREQAGDLLEKSRLFASGLHWWQRGRYGRGSEGNGMLKPIAASKSPQAAFGLYMPTETPVPTDPYEVASEPIPQLERRHHYVWMYEYRRLNNATASYSGRPEIISSTPKSKTTLGYFW